MLLQGIYQLHLNGNPVGDSYFNPGWTDYARRLYYDAWDVTALLRPGTNALGAVVADGWYAGAPASPHGWLSTRFLIRWAGPASTTRSSEWRTAEEALHDEASCCAYMCEGRWKARLQLPHTQRWKTHTQLEWRWILGVRVYAGYVAIAGREQYGRRRALRLQLEVEMVDGKRLTACSTGDGWRWTDSGPTREADIYMGETYDARRCQVRSRACLLSVASSALSVAAQC
jgi:hypothetical protein